MAFTELASPAGMFTPADERETAAITTTIPETVTETKTGTAEEIITGKETTGPGLEIHTAPIVINPAIINASLDLAMQVPVLSKEQERQVKEAIEASKRVIEDAQWKTVEKDIADVFSRQEKEKLKVVYEKEMNKMDWKAWENKLRQAYENVNWEKVNEQLANAVSMVRIDSLQKVYTDALLKIDLAKAEMAEYNQSSIPDTDITLKDLEQKRQDLLKLNRYLKGIRTKRIVRL